MRIPRSHFNKINAILEPLGGVGRLKLFDDKQQPFCYFGASAALFGHTPSYNNISDAYNTARKNDPLVKDGFNWTDNDNAVAAVLDDKQGWPSGSYERVPLEEMLAKAGVTIDEDA